MEIITKQLERDRFSGMFLIPYMPNLGDALIINGCKEYVDGKERLLEYDERISTLKRKYAKRILNEEELNLNRLVMPRLVPDALNGIYISHYYPVEKKDFLEYSSTEGLIIDGPFLYLTIFETSSYYQELDLKLKKIEV